MTADTELPKSWRQRIGDSIPKPKELRAWGRATQTAVRRRVIEKTGKYGSAASSNGTPKPVYRRATH